MTERTGLPSRIFHITLCYSEALSVAVFAQKNSTLSLPVHHGMRYSAVSLVKDVLRAQDEESWGASKAEDEGSGVSLQD